MKKFKAISLLFVMLTLLVSLCFAVGCNNNSSGGTNSSESHISFNSLTVQGNNVYGTVSNATEFFDFANEITAGKTCEYVVSLDEFGIQTSLTKTVPLTIGNNTFYIFESVDGTPKNTFIVTIHRKPVYTVTFNTNGGTPIQSQTVEEGYLASIPTEQITKLGYTFTGWDFDFTAPIIKSITIDAKFEVKPEMANFTFTSNFSTCEITGLKDKSVTQVIIPDYVTSIGDLAFYGCSSLTSVVIPDSVTSIGSSAFSCCSGLISVEIPYSVTSIGDDAFYGCSSLTSVVIPDSVTYIGSYAFYCCYKLVEVINKSSHITVTKGSTSNGCIGYYALSVSNRDNAYVSKFTNDNGYIIYTEGVEKVLVGYTGTETALTLPSYVTRINQYAFYYCSSLTSVVIPDSVTSIGDSAFCGCTSLTSVVIPDSVTSIGDRAFEYCYSLTSIKYRGTQIQWYAISKGDYWDSNTGDYTRTYNYTGE